MTWSFGDHLLRIKPYLWLILLLLATSLVVTLHPNSEAFAQTPVATPAISDDQVNAVARQLYCPVCENIPLDVCPTTACAQWRDLIRLMLSQGKSVDYINNYFVNYYGARVLPLPPSSGFNLLIYILPPVIFLIGAYLIYRILRKAQRPKTQNTPPVIELQPQNKYYDQIEEELRKRR